MTRPLQDESRRQDHRRENGTGGGVEIKTAALKEVAPAQAARLSFQPKDLVWQLNLDQIEAQSGRILSKVTGLASAAGTSTQPFDTGNVLYSKLRPYLNKVVCPDSPGIATTELVPLRPHPKKLDRQYLTYYLRSPEFVTWISNEVAGAKMPRVTMKVFWDHEIPLPPLAEQKRIAAILDAADALRTKRREALAQLDALLQSTFLTLFDDPVSNPMGWEMAAMGSQLKVIGGYAFKSEDFQETGSPVIRISNLNKDSIDLDGCARIPKAKIGKGEKFRIIAGDTLIAMSGATTGKLGLVPDDLNDEWYLNQRVGAFRIPDISRIDREYLRALLASPFYQRHVLNLAGGAAQPNISGKQLESAEIPLPPLPLQQKFAAIVESVERQKTTQRAHLAELDALFAALQHRAFRGEL
ncbi:MAG: restriction endonuclease subunit S [Akkermansiaceae bacterium]|nr:restriction endonuclease subunit S [Akkermansiaceae bacterium]